MRAQIVEEGWCLDEPEVTDGGQSNRCVPLLIGRRGLAQRADAFEKLTLDQQPWERGRRRREQGPIYVTAEGRHGEGDSNVIGGQGLAC